MAKINRKYIDKHWSVFMIRGLLACVIGFLTSFGTFGSLEHVFSLLAVALIGMGIIDSVSAIYASVKKRGWFTYIVDSVIDVCAALALLFIPKESALNGLIVIAVYTIVSGLIDLFHAFASTVDPTDRFIRIVAGILGCVLGIVVLNTGGSFEVLSFIRFFGSYMFVVGITSLIYGVHNRSQNIEDKVARKEVAKKPKKKTTKKAK